MWFIIIILIIVPFIPFRVEGRGRVFFVVVVFPIFPHSFSFWGLNHASWPMTKSAPRWVFQVSFRLMFQICMHCSHFPGLGMLVPCSRNTTLISKIIMGLWQHKTWICIKCIGLSHWSAVVLLCRVCVCVCVCVCVMLGCHVKLQSKTLKADHPFFAFSILNRMFSVTN